MIQNFFCDIEILEFCPLVSIRKCLRFIAFHVDITIYDFREKGGVVVLVALVVVVIVVVIVVVVVVVVERQQVVAHGAGEEERILRDHGDASSQRLDGGGN